MSLEPHLPTLVFVFGALNIITAVIVSIGSHRKNDTLVQYGSVGCILFGLLVLFFGLWIQREQAVYDKQMMILAKADSAVNNHIASVTNYNNELAKADSAMNKHISDLADRNNHLASASKSLISEIENLTDQTKTIVQGFDRRSQKQEAENSVVGQIKFNFTRKFQAENWVSVSFGSVTANNTVSDIKKWSPVVVGELDKPLLRFDIIDNKLVINASLIDLRGNWICDIENNVWRRNPNVSGKFNYDSTGVEIVDNQNLVALSVDIAAENKIQVQGYLVNPNTGLVTFGGVKGGVKPCDIKMPMNHLLEDYNSVGIRPLFIYNSTDWLGKRVSGAK